MPISHGRQKQEHELRRVLDSQKAALGLLGLLTQKQLENYNKSVMSIRTLTRKRQFAAIDRVKRKMERIRKEYGIQASDKELNSRARFVAMFLAPTLLSS